MRNIIGFVLCFISISFYAQTIRTPGQKIDSLFSIYSMKTPGVAVSVVKDGNIIFEKGYGMANLEYDIGISPKTVFHIASVSKQFTTFAIYLLEKQGKISLNDDVRKYIPELPVYEKTITIKHLCAHTSGLKDQWSLLTLAGWRMDDAITTEQILKVVSRQKELNFTPGSQFKYSNTGYTLLAEIIKRVTNKSFAEYTQENIFGPLQMNNTQFYDDNNKIVKNRAYSYGTKDAVYEKRNLNYSTVGPTSLFTTVSDLSKWTLNFEDPIVGDAELLRRYNEISQLDNGDPAILSIIDGETIYHAKGQFKRKYKGIDLYNHTGSDAGFKTYLVRFPEFKLSIILLSNDENFASLKSGLDIAEFYLLSQFKPQEIKKDVAKNLKAEKAKDPFKNNLKDFEGTFRNSDLESSFTVKIKNDKLTLLHNRLSDAQLIEVGKDKFGGTITFPVDVNFIRNQNSEITALSITNFGSSNVIFTKMK